jgi:DNA-binding MarR family transcriptional regulator
MLFTNIANSKFNPCRWECFMERKQLVEKSRQSFTRLARFINQLMREQLFCGPVTVQQCYTLEALTDGPKSMSTLAAEVALHQSTLTRIVDKLEKQNLLTRRRKENNQRTVEVQITEAGQQVHALLAAQSSQVISELLDLIPENRRVAVVESMEELANLLDPGNEAFRNLLKDCRCGFNLRSGSRARRQADRESAAYMGM